MVELKISRHRQREGSLSAARLWEVMLNSGALEGPAFCGYKDEVEMVTYLIYEK